MRHSALVSLPRNSCVIQEEAYVYIEKLKK